MSSAELPPQPDKQAGRPWLKLLELGVGILSIFTGVLLGLLMVRGLLISGNLKRDAWNVGGAFVFCLLAIFLVWIGARAVRRSRGRTTPQPVIRWGRMLAGVWLIFFSLKSHFAPDANSLKADNGGEAFGIAMATILMTAGGIMLIANSLQGLKRKPPRSAGT